MQHDFGSSGDDFTDLTIDRYHPDGTKCTDDSGIMDYFGVRKLWIIFKGTILASSDTLPVFEHSTIHIL